ncbi:MAG TPA: hypothetical protein VK897_19370 [Anaerolineales bacterium]|nr:hypothetical protein [Anaerolineales bacterium]
MSDEKHQEESPISKEAEEAARAERERFFQSMIPQMSGQVVAAHMVESLARASGFDPNKIPADLVNSLKALREQLTSREPPPLEESKVPPSWE